MNISTPDLCDAYPNLVRVLEPIFTNYGGITSFGGKIVTVKCFEDNSVVKESAGKPGEGKVMVVGRRRVLEKGALRRFNYTDRT